MPWAPRDHEIFNALTPAEIENLKKRFNVKWRLYGTSKCRFWTACVTSSGYGQIKVKGRMLLAHRVAYYLSKGSLPSGRFLDHLCRRPCCVNPSHLDPVSHRENLIRGKTIIAAKVAQTHCVHGHAFDEQNTLYKSNGCRDCRTCQRIRNRRNRRKRDQRR